MIHPSSRPVAAIDLFCGAGGLSYGLETAGVNVLAGADIDPTCRYPFEANIGGATFLERDARLLAPEELVEIWPQDSLRLLAGCAPCQPFSPYQRGRGTPSDSRWPLLREFGRLVKATQPELVTTENVPRLMGTSVFKAFVELLRDLSYSIAYRTCNCADYGLPQKRRRLVLIASRLGPIDIPDGHLSGLQPRTVGDAIRRLPPIAAGETDAADPLHRSRRLQEINRQRIRASVPGGSWQDWPEELRAPCHRRASGKRFRNVYARMSWADPAPTLTTYFHNFGAGRYGHPEQDRAISIREGAMLQGFPADYDFVEPGSSVSYTTLGRLIGNAVPPPLGAAIGKTIINHIEDAARND